MPGTRHGRTLAFGTSVLHGAASRTRLWGVGLTVKDAANGQARTTEGEETAVDRQLAIDRQLKAGSPGPRRRGAAALAAPFGRKPYTAAAGARLPSTRPRAVPPYILGAAPASAVRPSYLAPGVLPPHSEHSVPGMPHRTRQP
jgi:hypothetical protein